MSNDNEHDDTLGEFDLSAWEVPGPQHGLADAVIARAAERTGAAAIEPTERPKRWWIAAAAGAVVASAAVIAIIVARGAHHTGASHGDVVAVKPQHLDLETVSADLEAGATITWKRDHDGLTVSQCGSATWRVADDEHLRIETGAALASIEASGASLRVEAHMNLSDARVIGASAATAAAVAFVTVVVYEGHVKVDRSGQIVNIEPGATVELRPNKPPTPPDLVGANRADQLENQIRELQDENAKLKQQQVGGGATGDSCDEVSCVLTNYNGACCAKLKPSRGKGLDDAAVAAGIAKIEPQWQLCGAGHAGLASMDVTFIVKPDGTVGTVSLPPALPDAKTVACVKAAISGARFDRAAKPTHVDYRLTFKHAVATCDAVDLADKGRANINASAFAAALENFELSLACKDDPKIYPLAFTSACQAKMAESAKHFYAKLPQLQQTSLIQICLKNEIDPRADQTSATPAPCDAQALVDEGLANLNVNAFAAALAKFETALRCKDDPKVDALAFAAACEANMANKAKSYYAKLSPERQSSLIQICLRNKIDPRANPTAVLQTKCDPVDLADRGRANLEVSAFAAALANFEQALACQNDPKLYSLAFVAACQAYNSDKAKLYYSKLPPEKQRSLAPTCLRNQIDPASGDFTTDFDVSNASTAKEGYLQVFSKPPAKIQIDGTDTGKTTPITGRNLALVPGKHKITFVIGGDRFTYSVTIKAGATEIMTKDLQ